MKNFSLVAIMVGTTFFSFQDSSADECLEVSNLLAKKINDGVFVNSSPASVTNFFARRSEQQASYYLVAGELPLSDKYRDRNIAVWAVDDLNEPSVIYSAGPSAKIYSSFPLEKTKGFEFFGNESFQPIRKCLIDSWVSESEPSDN